MSISVNFEQGNSVPRIVRITTTSTLAQVIVAGWYPNTAPNQLNPSDQVEIAYAQGTTSAATAIFGVSISAGVVTLAAAESSVVFPVVSGHFANFSGTTGAISDAGFLPSDASKTRVVMAGSAVQTNYIAHYVDTTGTVDDTAAAIINDGTIQSGKSGVAGGFIAYPGTAANGFLELLATNAGGAFNTIVSNGTMGQTSTITITDPGASTANFILSANASLQSITAGAFTVNAGAITSGLSTGGFVGLLKAFPTTASKGFIALSAAVNATGNFGTTITNALAQAQASVITIPDPGAATSNFVLSQSTLPTNNVAFTKVLTLGFAALATAGKINIAVHPTGTSQFAVLDIKVLTSTGLSGGGGNRLLAVSDGTIVFNNAGITAALLGTPIFTLWGGTGNPVAVGAAQVSTAGADIFFQYTGGATDYTAGSVQIAVTLVQVTA